MASTAQAPFLAWVDLIIDRKVDPSVVTLYDSEGLYIGTLPASICDDHIKAALGLANNAYQFGFAAGSAAGEARLRETVSQALRGLVR